MTPIFSILIPTLEVRRPLFQRLHADLRQQIETAGLAAAVEILVLSDGGEALVGAKRNTLLQQARGEFVAFVDDDDAVAPDYVQRICATIRANPDIDCIGLVGRISFRGAHEAYFIHSLRYDDYRSERGRYLRPPYHLNPIRRSIAVQFPFAEVNYSEDIDWALRLRDAKALKSEAYLEDTLYYYASRRWWPYQWLLDRTERLRHALGLRFANRLQWREPRRS